MFTGNLPQWVLYLSALGSNKAEETPQNLGGLAHHAQHHSTSYAAAMEAVLASETSCEALAKQLKDRVVFPTDRKYSTAVSAYWSLREHDLQPACVVEPHSAEEISVILQTFSAGASKKKDGYEFAIRGGGHTPFPGAANIQDGPVISLSNLPSPGLARDHKTITISPSVKWDEVFEELDEHGLATLGGRVAGVGVGGLTTGCGISYFSPRYGYTCNMVDNFQVVLANGDIVNANASSHQPLFKALKGGSNNFGVVTAITLRTFKQGRFWGGQAFHTIADRLRIFKDAENFIGHKPYDPYAHFINTVAYTNMTRNWFVGNSMQYTKSDPPVPEPEVFKPFLDVQRVPLFPGAPDNTFRVDNQSAFTREYAALSFYPKRWRFATVAFGNSAEMMEEFFQLTNKTAQPFGALPGFQIVISYQPMPTIITERYGGVDSLGPIQTEGDMFIIHFAMAVDASEAKYEGDFDKAVQKLFHDAEEFAAKRGLKRNYLPLTYSDKWQNPIGQRTQGTIDELWKASEKYDPEGLFQTHVPGGFKLPKKSSAHGMDL